MEEYASNQTDFIFNQIENLLDKQQQEMLWYMENFFTEDEMKNHSENLLQIISKSKSEIPFIKMQLLKKEVNGSLPTYEELRKVGWQIAFAKGALWLLDKLTPIEDTKCVCKNCEKEFIIPKEKMLENYRQCTFCGSLKWDEMNEIKDNTCEERNESYAVIGEWTESDGTEKWDVIHSGPISYEEALKIAHLATKTWNEHVSHDRKHLPHSESPIKYELLLKKLKNSNLNL
jgi:hypothetical protein